MEHQVFLESGELREPVRTLVSVLEKHSAHLASDDIAEIPHVLDVVRVDLEVDGWRCSSGKRSTSGIALETSSGRRILADAWHPSGTALWVETGRSWTNFAFLQHAIEAALVPDLDEAAIAVRHRWKGQSTFDNCAGFLAELFGSDRLRFPYRRLTLIGF